MAERKGGQRGLGCVALAELRGVQTPCLHGQKIQQDSGDSIQEVITFLLWVSPSEVSEDRSMGASLTFKRFSSCLDQSKMEANGSQQAREGFLADRVVEGPYSNLPPGNGCYCRRVRAGAKGSAGWRVRGS